MRLLQRSPPCADVGMSLALGVDWDNGDEQGAAWNRDNARIQNGWKGILILIVTLRIQGQQDS